MTIGVLLALASSSEAASWIQIGNPDLNIFYSKSDNAGAIYDRVIGLSEALLTDDAIIMASFLKIPSTNNIQIDCKKFTYQGEMNNSFIFMLSVNTISISNKDDPYNGRNYEKIMNPNNAQDRGVSMYIACLSSYGYKNIMSVYIPTLNSSLNLPMQFSDANISLFRLKGTGIRPEFNR